MNTNNMTTTKDLFKFDSLKLVDKPDSPRNAKKLPQTLHGCEGCLDELPLKAPNVDQKKPVTIQDMINILTDSEAAAKFDAAEQALAQQGDTDSFVSSRSPEGMPSAVYDYNSSGLMKAELKKAHARSRHKKASFFGHVVNPGCISFYEVDGKTFAVTEGRWMLTGVKAKWVQQNLSLDRDEIALSSGLLIIRVPSGSVGRILDQGNEVLLGVGTHVFNSGTVSNAGTVQYSNTLHFQHGPYNYIRVPRGWFAKVWAVCGSNGVKSVQPRLLQEGEHFIASHLFKLEGQLAVSTPYIQHGSIHRVIVEKGYVVKVWHDNLPRLLGEGDHVIESTQFKFIGPEDIIESNCIVHGTITILRVSLGQVALAMQMNEPTFIDRPGLFEFDSPDFRFVEFKNADEQLIQLGAKKIILVHTGQVGVTFDHGQLKILPNGRHVINSGTHTFQRFLSTQQKSIRLTTLNAEEKMARKSTKTSSRNSDSYSSARNSAKTTFAGPDSDLTICETKDLVKIGMRADVFYSIEDPEKCITKIDTEELEDLVRETAVSTLTNIIRSTALNEIAQSHTVSAGKAPRVEIMQPPTNGDNSQQPAPSAVFFDKVHDEFIAKLNEDFLERYGVDIANIRIESFRIMDDELAEQISKQALTTAQIENEMANLEGKALISTTQGRTAAEVQAISAQAEAQAEKTRADAENQRQVDAALAAAEAHKIRVKAEAESEADAILTRAKAEAEAIRLKAAAEAERAEVLSRTKLGQQEALLSQYSEMVVESNRGVSKVVYLDPSVNRDSPFAIGSLQNLNNDLHSLTRLGIAADGTNGHNGNGATN